MRVWDIWVEGHGAQGNPSTARCVALGVVSPTFEEAVAGYVATLPPEEAKVWTFERVPGRGWEQWGCRAFPDEASARRSFG